MEILERCQEAQKAIQAVIVELRKNPNVHPINCNLLENHTNALLGHSRNTVGWCKSELPNIST